MAKRTKDDALLDLTRHQAYLEQLKNGLVRDADKALNQLSVAVSSILADIQLGTMDKLTRGQLNRVLKQVEEAHADLMFNTFSSESRTWADLAAHEARWESSFINANKRGRGIKARAAKADDAYRQVRLNPVGKTGETLAGYTKGVSNSTLGKFNKAIRNGWTEGRPIQDVVREFRQLKGAGTNLTVKQARREAETYVRTATQHVSQQARMATWEANSDLVEGYTILATLDGRTSPICRSLDGQEFEMGKGPVPPLHPGCRSTTLPKLGAEFDFLDEGATRSSEDGYVSAEKNYYDWLKGNPDKAREILGKTRSDLFLNGGLSPDNFAKYGINSKNFQPLTLQQMMDKDSAPFRAAGIDTWPGKATKVDPPTLPPKAFTRVEHAQDEMLQALGSSQSKGVEVLKIESGGKPVGAMSYSLDEDGYLEVNHIGSNIKGGGTDLMRAAARKAQDLDLEMVLDADPDAVAFYRKLGFKGTPTDAGSLTQMVADRRAVKELAKPALSSNKVVNALKFDNPMYVEFNNGTYVVRNHNAPGARLLTTTDKKLAEDFAGVHS